MTPILLDTAIAIVIILSTLGAFLRGFIKEMLTIVNLAGAAGAAYLFGPMLVDPYKNWLGVTGDPKTTAKAIWGVVPPEVMATFLAYGSAFFGVFIILSLAGMAISSGAKALGLGPVDKTMGLIFGALRGFLIVFFLYLPIPLLSDAPEKIMPDFAKESLSVPVLQATYEYLDKYLDGDKDKDSTDAEKEEEIDPNSLKGKLKKMGDKLIEAGHEATDTAIENTDETPTTTDILTDDEKQQP
jgi:membrane protein required for colicin V production